MKRNFLLIGFSEYIIEELRQIEDIDIYVIEEDRIFYDNKLDKSESNKYVKKIIFTEYMNSKKYIADVDILYDSIQHLDAVMPVRDYAVQAAGLLAEKYSVKGIGQLNSEILTNKYILRQACKKYDIPHPRYSKITTIDELKSFVEAGNRPVIFKPSNRQASLGVSKVESIKDVERAWEYTTNSDESGTRIVKRNMEEEYIAEDYIVGFEVSVETIVQNSRIIFVNITSKISSEDSFVELGHVVPANLDKNIKNRILKENRDFIHKLKIEDGLLHSEWKIENGNPVLIECAGRSPGDGIPMLIEYTYGFNLFKCLGKVYLGDAISIPNEVKIISTSRFFVGKSGVVKKVSRF